MLWHAAGSLTACRRDDVDLSSTSSSGPPEQQSKAPRELMTHGIDQPLRDRDSAHYRRASQRRVPCHSLLGAKSGYQSRESHVISCVFDGRNESEGPRDPRAAASLRGLCTAMAPWEHQRKVFRPGRLHQQSFAHAHSTAPIPSTNRPMTAPGTTERPPGHMLTSARHSAGAGTLPGLGLSLLAAHPSGLWLGPTGRRIIRGPEEVIHHACTHARVPQ